MELERIDESIDLKTIPIIALRQKGCLLLSQLLNPIKILPSEEGYPRDWRGIAYLSGIQNLNGTSVISNNEQDAMGKVLQLWYKEKKSMATFGNLRTFLRIIDRWDVADDINEILYEDAKFYLDMKQESNVNSMNSLVENMDVDENIITKDDVIRAREGLPPQFYDAFVLFADEDIDFAIELIEKMENYGLKLCVRERDLIGGISFEHEAILRLISDRCNRLIVIVSPAFLKSRANAFFVNYAQALGIEQGRRKIVPCLYEHCVLPPTLNFYFLLNYQRSGRLWNFWEKLKDSIQSTPAEVAAKNKNICNNILQVPSIQITEVVSNQSAITQSNTTPKIVSSVPQKPPRKHSQKEITYTGSWVQRENVNDIINESSSSDNCNTNNRLQENQFESDLRTQSLTNLEKLKSQKSPIDCDKTKSNNDVSQLKSGQTTTTGKNTKWYRKILSVSSIFDSSKLKNSKKHLTKKKLTVVH